MSNFSSAINYLPHDTPMVLIDKVLKVTQEQAVSSVVVSQDSILAPFLNNKNQLPAWFAIEMMAQTIGVWRGWHSQQMGHNIKLGLLLGVRDFKTKYATYALASELRVSVELLLQDTQLAHFNCQLTIENELIAKAKLNVYQPSVQEIEQLIK